MFKSLVNLAIDKEGSALSNTSLSPALAAAVEARRARANEAAAEELISVIDSIESQKSALRRSIKTLRKQIEGQIKKMDSIDRLFSYAQETSNFLPLLVETGKVYSARCVGLTTEEFAELSKVPADYQPVKDKRRKTAKANE